VLNNIILSIRRLFSLGVVRRDSVKNKVRFLQVELDQNLTLDDIEHLEPFGFTSRVFDGADAVIISQGGNRGKSICLMTADRRYRIDIEKGESAIYNSHGDKVLMRKDRVIEMATPAKVLVNAPLLECNDLLVKKTATIKDKAIIEKDAVINSSSYIGHGHRENGRGNDTNTPNNFPAEGA